MSRPGLAKRPATYADLLQVPDHLVAEILEGVLYATPRPAARHALATSALGVEIGGPFHSGRGGPGGWWILDEPEIHLGLDVVVPDLAGWRRSTLPEIPNAPAMTVAPDWICEVLSPSTEALDRVPKLRIYARRARVARLVRESAVVHAGSAPVRRGTLDRRRNLRWRSDRARRILRRRPTRVVPPVGGAAPRTHRSHARTER